MSKRETEAPFIRVNSLPLLLFLAEILEFSLLLSLFLHFYDKKIEFISVFRENNRVDS